MTLAQPTPPGRWSLTVCLPISGRPARAGVLDHESNRSFLIGQLLAQFRDLAVLVVLLLADRREVPAVDVRQIQQVRAVAQYPVQPRNIPPIQIPLPATDARPRALVAFHVRADFFRLHAGELAGILQRFGGALQNPDMLKTHRPADDLSIGDQRELLAILTSAGIC